MTSTLSKSWEPGVLEPKIYENWVEQGYFTPDPSADKLTFSIVMPPPNVNGNLHIGHAFGHVISDIICRHRRALGYDVLWLPGTDHAGIATQIAVEKDLASRGIHRTDLTREQFLTECFAFVDRVKGNVLGQMRLFGDSADWSRLRFTLDDQLSLAVRTIFKKLYDAGYIYRAERLVNWSPKLESAVSDLEIVHKEIDGELVSFRYGSSDAAIIVATTRLETILGDTAIAVHPDDARYTHLIGTAVQHPFLDREIPIVADEHVDPEFGTGAVKVTPAHDPNDYELGKRHNLSMPNIMDKSGHIVNTGTTFDGMDRFTARKAIRDKLDERGLIVQEIRPYKHSVAHSERSDEPIEPLLSLQWWVKVEDLAKASGDAVREEKTLIYPPSQNARWFEWVDNMHDWCISRQLWWGHRIPVWYGPDGEILVPGPHDPIPEGYVQDPDVLDTWFSSALFPFSTMGWPSGTIDLQRYYPTSLLITGYDIIFFWVARMMMMGYFAYQIEDEQIAHPKESIPFHEVYLTGLVRDEFGRKMSKSKGNGIDPVEMIKEYGVDAARFALARGANPGADHNIGATHAELARNFVTKIYNATRFAMMNGAQVAELPAEQDLTEADKWILSRLRHTITSVDADLADYACGKVSDTLYHFAWDDLCDWYLEIAKIQIKAGKSTSTQIVLGVVFDTLLRLLHPILPFVTEVLWQELTREDSIVLAPWPVIDQLQADPQSEILVEDAQKLITEIRRFRNDQGIKPSAQIVAHIIEAERFSPLLLQIIAGLTKIDLPTHDFIRNGEIEVPLQNGMITVQFDTSGGIDLRAEKAKLEKELSIARKDFSTSEIKLQNPEFLTNAPAAVVEKITQRYDTARLEIDRIEQRLAQL